MENTTKPTMFEVRLNSEHDAKRAVANFRNIIADVKKRGMKGVTWVIEKTKSRDIHRTLATFFRAIKNEYAYMEAPPNREFYALSELPTPDPLAARKPAPEQIISPTEVHSVPLHIDSSLEAGDPEQPDFVMAADQPETVKRLPGRPRKSVDAVPVGG